MLIIDRYLLREFLKTFFICYCSLTGLYIVFHLFTNFEDFLRCADKGGGLWRLMARFYFYQSIVFFESTSALLTLISSMFTVTWIQRHNELTALMSAGISRVRVVRPIIGAAIALSLLGTVNRELVIPKISSKLGRTPSDVVGDHVQEIQPRRDNQTDIQIGGKLGFPKEMRIEHPVFWLPQGLNRYGDQLVAENAYYRPPDKGRPGGYLLKGVTEPKGLAAQPSLPPGGKPLLLTAHDAPDWLAPDQCFVASNVEFEQLTSPTTFREFASTAQLIQGLHNPSLGYGAEVRVLVHSRIVQPLLDVTLIFLGLPLVVSRQSQNVFFAIGLCLLVVVLFLFVQMGFHWLGTNSVLPAALAAWIPLMLSVPAAVGLAHSMWE
jgi:lipopolysaccharide export system permease protein